MDGERGNKQPNYQQVSDVDTRNKHSLTIEENDKLCLIYTKEIQLYINYLRKRQAMMSCSLFNYGL